MTHKVCTGRGGGYSCRNRIRWRYFSLLQNTFLVASRNIWRCSPVAFIEHFRVRVHPSAHTFQMFWKWLRSGSWLSPLVQHVIVVLVFSVRLRLLWAYRYYYYSLFFFSTSIGAAFGTTAIGGADIALVVRIAETLLCLSAC